MYAVRVSIERIVSVSASRIVASKLNYHGALAALWTCFSIRESDRCLETPADRPGQQRRAEFQYPRVGSLPRNPIPCFVQFFAGNSFSIRESDRCLETGLDAQAANRFLAVSVSASRIVASKPITADAPFREFCSALSVSASRIVASKRDSITEVQHVGTTFQYPRVGSLPRNLTNADLTDVVLRAFSIRESDRCLET